MKVRVDDEWECTNILHVFKRWLDECVLTRASQAQRSSDSSANKSSQVTHTLTKRSTGESVQKLTQRNSSSERETKQKNTSALWTPLSTAFTPPCRVNSNDHSPNIDQLLAAMIFHPRPARGGKSSRHVPRKSSTIQSLKRTVAKGETRSSRPYAIVIHRTQYGHAHTIRDYRQMISKCVSQ